MTTKKQREFSESLSAERQQHALFTKDVLTPKGAPVIARHRVRMILTPLEVRLAILEENAAKPEAVRVRSLRRRLTPLDRALSDREAEMLERLTLCMNGLTNVRCVDLLRSEVRTAYMGRLPFGECRRQEIAAMTYVLQRLGPQNHSVVTQLACFLDPSASRACFKPSQAFIAALKQAAERVIELYDAWYAHR